VQFNQFYWVVRKVRAAKDLNLINEIKNLNLLRFNFPSKSASKTNFLDDPINQIMIRTRIYILGVIKRNPLFFHSISFKNNGFLFTTPNM